MLREMHHEDDHGHDAKKGEAKHDHDHDHGKHDPHVWLGIPEVIKMVEVIKVELVKVDPAHEGDYETNAKEYIRSLKKLEEDGKKLLADKKVKRIVSFHDALGYFARTFDVVIADVIEQGPGDEPRRETSGGTGEIVPEQDEADRSDHGGAAVSEKLVGGDRTEGAEGEGNHHRTGGSGPSGNGGSDGTEERGGGMVRKADATQSARAGPCPEIKSVLATIRGLRVLLGGTPILCGVDADLERGRITAVIGLNGAGKTTLLRALLKEVPFTGVVRFHCGHDHSGPVPRHIGYVPQKLRMDANLPLTVLDLFGLSLLRRPLFLGLGRGFRARAKELLGVVGASHLVDCSFEALSGGERQRVLLSLALEPRPELLLLDEPAAGIDFQMQQSFHELISRLNRDTGVTVLLVSHDLSMVSQIADHVLCMKDGRIECQGAPNAILEGGMLARTFGADAGIYVHRPHAH